MSETGIFARRGFLRISDVLHGREFALIGVSRTGAALLLGFIDRYVLALEWLAKRLMKRVPGWFFNALFGFLRLSKACLLRFKLEYALRDPIGLADHPDWRDAL